MKKVIIFIIAISLAAIFSGCFDVERNNPYDPDGDLAGNQWVELKGVTYKGNSQDVMANVQIDIGGKTVYSNSLGEYKVQLNPGNYTLTALLDGWSNTNIEVDLTVSKKNTIVKTVTKDIKMFIWKDDFESYSTIFQANPPWTSDVWANTPGNAYLMLSQFNTNQGILVHLDDPVAGWSKMILSSIPMPTPATVTTFDAVVVFKSGMTNSSQKITLFETTAGHFFTLDFDGTDLFYNSPAMPMNTLLKSNFSNTDQVLLVHFELETIAGLTGYISIFNYQGNAILNPTSVLLSATAIPEIESCEFFVESWNPSPKAELLVLDVWFY